MERNSVINFILKDIEDIKSIASTFENKNSIPPIYIDLVLSKTRNLYTELFMLQKIDTEINEIESIESVLPQDMRASDEIEKTKTPIIRTPKTPTPTFKTVENVIVKKVRKITTIEERDKMREKEYLITTLNFPPIKNLNDGIELQDKILFINDLFNKSIDKYKQTISFIDRCDNLEEVFNYIDSNLKWYDDDTTTKKFMHLLYRRYS